MTVVILGTAAAALYWRIGNSPLSMPMLTDAVTARIRATLPAGFDIAVGGVRLGRRDGAVALLLDDVRLVEPAGTTLAAAPHVVAEFGWSGLLTPQTIVVEGVSATLSVGKDGRINLRPGADAPPLPAAGGDISVPAMLGAFDTIMAASAPVAALELRDAALTLHEETFGRSTVYRGIRLAVRRTSAPGGLSVSVGAGSGTVTVTVEGRPDGARLVDAQARDISAGALLAGLAPGAPPPDITARLDAVGRARIEGDGRVAQATLVVSSSGGTWRVAPDTPVFAFDRVALALRWDPIAGVVAVDRAALSAGEGGADFSGRVTPPGAASPVWMIDLSAPSVILAGSRPDEAPLTLDHATIRARFDPATGVLGLDKGELSGPTASVAMAGSVSFGASTPGIGLGLVASKMPATAMKRLWPFFAAPKAREWMGVHLKGGSADAFSLSIAIPPGALLPVDGVVPPLPAEAIDGHVDLSQGTLSLFDTVPDLSDLSVRASFTGRMVEIGVDAATLDLKEYGILALSQGVYRIPDLAPTPAQQHVALRASGPAAAIARLMTLPPLSRAADGVPIDPSKVRGGAVLDVTLDMPLVDEPPDDGIRYAIAGTMTNAAIDDFEGGALDNATLKIAAEPGVLLLTGKATFNGLPATIDFRKAKDAAPQIAAVVTLDDEMLRRKGFDFGDALSGPVVAEVRIDHDTYDVDVDLGAARIRDLLPGWEKPAGRAAKATFTLVRQPEGDLLRAIALDSGPLSLRGSVSLTPAGGLRRAEFDTVRFSPGDDARATLEATAQGWKASMSGASLDLRPILQTLQQGGPGKGGPGGADVAVSLDLDKAVGFGGETATGLSAQIEMRGALVRRVALKAGLGPSRVTIAQKPGADGSGVIAIDASDAGRLLRFLDYYSHAYGGTLTAVMTPKLDSTAGQIAVRSFAVSDEPALGQYRTTLKAGRADAVQQVANGNSAQFTKLKIGFRRSASKITILDGVVWGSDVGVSIAGDIDYAQDRVAMTGTFVPAYALNNLFGQIPILGEILGGGSNGGLFAINFKVSGPVSAPVLTVNPLSAIAPGFLRKLFEFQKE